MKISESLMLIVIAFILGAVALKSTEFLLEDPEPVTILKPIAWEWLLFVTEIEGEPIQVRFLEEDFEDFQKLLTIFGVLVPSPLDKVIFSPKIEVIPYMEYKDRYPVEIDSLVNWKSQFTLAKDSLEYLHPGIPSQSIKRDTTGVKDVR